MIKKIYYSFCVLIFLTSTCFARSLNSVTDKTIGYFPLNEQSGTTSINKSNSSAPMTVGGAAWVTGKYGNALSFAGGSTTNVANSDVFISTSITINFWIYKANFSAADYQMYIVKSNTNGGAACNYWIDNGAAYPGLIRFIWGAGAAYSLGATIGTDYHRWRMITCTFDNASKTATIYLNGQYNSSTVSAGGLGLSPSNFTIGYMTGESLYKLTGTIDDISIWNRCLSANEIKALYRDSANGRME